MGAVLAARVSDQVGNHASFWGALIGLALGIIAGIVIVAILGGIILTGGALLVVASIAGAICLTAAAGAAGERLGEAFDKDAGAASGTPCSPIIKGCETVFIETQMAARIDDPSQVCSNTHTPAVLKEGSAWVHIGQKAASRHKDKATCTGTIIVQTKYTYIGGPVEESKVPYQATWSTRLHDVADFLDEVAKYSGYVAIGAAILAGAPIAVLAIGIGATFGGEWVGGKVGAGVDSMLGYTDGRFENFGKAAGGIAGGILGGKGAEKGVEMLGKSSNPALNRLGEIGEKGVKLPGEGTKANDFLTKDWRMKGSTPEIESPKIDPGETPKVEGGETPKVEGGETPKVDETTGKTETKPDETTGKTETKPDETTGKTEPKPDETTGKTEPKPEEKPPEPTGPKEMSPQVKEAIKDLPPDMQEQIAKSPKLQQQIEDLQNDPNKPWKLEVDPNKTGADAARGKNEIKMGPGYDTTDVLAHEVGHAKYPLEPEVPPDGLTRDQYVEDNLQRHLRDEGAAKFNEFEINKDLVSNGGKEIKPAGSDPANEAIYKEFEAGKLTKEQAIQQMGENFRDYKTSTTGQTYEDFYGKGYKETWDGWEQPKRDIQSAQDDYNAGKIPGDEASQRMYDARTRGSESRQQTYEEILKRPDLKPEDATKIREAIQAEKDGRAADATAHADWMARYKAYNDLASGKIDKAAYDAEVARLDALKAGGQGPTATPQPKPDPCSTCEGTKPATASEIVKDGPPEEPSGPKVDGQKAEAVKSITDKIGSNIKTNPLRQAYESEVAGLKGKGEEMLKSGMSKEDVARALNQERRDIGVKYKHLTPEPLRDYIYEVNQGRYGDPLGPKYDDLLKSKMDSGMTREQADQSIIDGASRPNPDVDKLLGKFGDWLGKKDPTYIENAQRSMGIDPTDPTGLVKSPGSPMAENPDVAKTKAGEAGEAKDDAADEGAVGAVGARGSGGGAAEGGSHGKGFTDGRDLHSTEEDEKKKKEAEEAFRRAEEEAENKAAEEAAKKGEGATPPHE